METTYTDLEKDIIFKATIKEIGANIDFFRKKRNLSYQEMADLCGLDKAQAHKICTVGKDLRISTLIKISKGLKVNVRDIFDVG